MRQFLIVIVCFSYSPLFSQKPLQLFFAGDVMAHSPQIVSALQPDGSYDFQPWFSELEPLIQQADFAIANLELTLPGKPPYTGYPQFRAPDGLARDLRQAGFDMLVTANNHSNDAYLNGVINTLDVLDQLGLQHTGTFRNKNERDALYPFLTFVGTHKICFLNYTYDTNGIPTPAPAHVNLIDTSVIKKDLAIARTLNADYIIAIMHWGLEYQLVENENQRQIASLLLREGTDLVVGMHPHVVQPIREETVIRYDGSTYKGLVAYSLGNFVSNQTKPHTDGGLVLQIELLPDEKGHLQLKSYRPIEICRLIGRKANGKAVYHVIPCTPDLVSAPDASVLQIGAMKKFSVAIRKRLGF